MDSFSLTKWYLDGVDHTGRSAIVYWTALGLGGLTITWHSVAIYEPGKEPYLRSSLAHSAEPEEVGGGLSWRADALGCTVTCERRLAPFGARLLEGDAGIVDWRCEAGAARTRMECAGQPALAGPGYAERLILTIPPWRLPIDELFWGRWVSDGGDRSVVWIDWRGAHPLTAVWTDGVRQPQAEVGGDRIVAGDDVLTLSAPRTLHARSVGDIVRTIGPVAALLPASWLAVEDRKCLSAGVLTAGGGTQESGWTIHERVRFP